MVSKSDAFSGRSADSLRLTVTQGTQSISSNKTTVNWYLDLIETWGSHVNDPTGSYSITINGTNYTGTVPGFGANKTTRIRTGSTSVTHNSDGTKTISMSASASGVAVVGSASIGSFSLKLSTIPRATTPNFSGGSSFNAGSAVTINLPRASSSFTHVVTYKFYSDSGTISSSAGSSVSWTPSTNLLEQIPNATSGGGTLTVKTMSGSTTVGTKSISFTLKAGPSAVPLISSYTVTDAASSVVSAIGEFVQAHSLVKAVFTATGYEGSTISTQTFSMDGATQNNGGVLPVPSSGNRSVVAYTKDSRGRTDTFTKTINVLPYSNPTLSTFKVQRSGSTGTVQADGTYLRIDLGATVKSLMSGTTEKNSMTIQISTRALGTTSWGSVLKTITAGTSYSGFTVLPETGAGNYDAGTSYDVQVVLLDKLESSRSQASVSTANIFMHWSKTGVGIGKFHELGALDVAGDIYQRGFDVIDSHDTLWSAIRASQAEANAGTNNTKAITPSTLANLNSGWKKSGIGIITASGWTLIGYAFRVQNGYLNGNVTVRYDGSTTISVPANNNFTDINGFVTMPVGYRSSNPRDSFVTIQRSGLASYFARVNGVDGGNNGRIDLTHGINGSDIVAGSSLECTLNYYVN